MKKALYILFIVAIAVSCKTSEREYERILQTNDLERPAGCVKISSNLYLDETEVSNFSYLEFLYWQGRVYPQKYSSYLPDSLSWNDEDTLRPKYKGDTLTSVSEEDTLQFTSPLVEYYMRHPAYRDYPVVGVSYEQAQAFSKWRSDRVMEFILIREGVIKFHTYTQNKDSIFTIEKYFTGKFAGIKPHPKLKWYPEYSLPDSVTYYKALRESDSVYALIKNIKVKGRFQTNLCNCKENRNKIVKIDGIDCFIRVYPYYNKRNRFYHLRGNARELTNVKGLAFGGSYLDSCNTTKNLISTYDSTDVHTGFRNMCIWKVWPGL